MASSSSLAAAAAATHVFLKGEKLRRLAELIRNHEVNNSYHITFPNVGEHLQYLRTCNENMASVNTILDECDALSNTYKCDTVRGPIAGRVIVYAEHCLNNALQVVRNHTLRRSYLDKMKDHLHQLFKALGGDAVADLVDSVEKLDRMIMSYMRVSLSSDAASAEFSRHLRSTGISFSQLVGSYQAKLGYLGEFEELGEEEKVFVYVAIVEASGRLQEKHDEARRRDRANLKYGSAAMFVKDVGMIAWKVYSADDPIIEVIRVAAAKIEDRGGKEKTNEDSSDAATMALRKVLVLAAKKGGVKLGTAAATKLTAAALGVTMAATSPHYIGVASGIVGGLVLGAAAGALFDHIVSSGGERQFPTDGFVVYVAPMPNGRDLAKLIF